MTYYKCTKALQGFFTVVDYIIQKVLVYKLLVTNHDFYRMRKLKERYGITDFRKHANRMTFGEVGLTPLCHTHVHICTYIIY